MPTGVKKLKYMAKTALFRQEGSRRIYEVVMIRIQITESLRSLSNRNVGHSYNVVIS